MTPQSYRQYLKIRPVKKHFLQYFTGESNFSSLRVITKIMQPRNISASAVPTNDLSRAALSRDVFYRFSVADFLAYTSNKLKQIKTFVQCSLLEKLPWNAVGYVTRTLTP